MKQRRAAFALGLLIVVVAVLAVRRFVRRASSRALPHGALSAQVRSPPALSVASAQPLPAPPRVRPAYLDTDAKTLTEQREALFANMKNQLDLPSGALDKFEAIFNASVRA